MNNQKFCYLIEDDRDDREFFSIAMKDLGNTVRFECAESASEGLKKLKAITKRFPDFIFLDLNMSPISGHDCLSEIKKVAKLADIPVIIYSTRLNEQIKYETLQLGAFDHYQKPSTVDELKEYLKRLLQLEEV